LKKIGVAAKHSDSETELNRQTDEKTSRKPSIIKNESVRSGNAEMLPIILAIIDEVRDAIFDVLSDEPSLRDELLQRVDTIAVSTQEELEV